jgi:hypothetical protein
MRHLTGIGREIYQSRSQYFQLPLPTKLETFYTANPMSVINNDTIYTFIIKKEHTKH